MNDPKTIKQGTYQTVNGKTAHVWAWANVWPGQWAYKGTITGEGTKCWGPDGRDTRGNDDLPEALS